MIIRPTRPLLAALALLAIASGCAHKPPPPPPPPQQPAAAPEPPPRERELRALADRVIRLRGLPEKTRLDIVVESREDFARRVASKLETSTRSDAARNKTRALLIAFGLIEPTLEPDKVARDLAQEQVAGFYDPESRRLFAADSLPPTLQNAANLTSQKAVLDGLLAHEIEHALAFDSYPKINPLAFTDSERRSGANAALEGDAMLLMMLLMAPTPVHPEQLVRNVRAFEKVPLEALIQLSGQSPQLASAPRFFRESMLFPYFSGMRLAAELYGAGGFPLVNGMLAHPPENCEQVLHPEKYLAGEPSIPVAAPSAPPGYRLIGDEIMGEFATRVLLSECLGDPAGRQAAEGWGGDRASVLEGTDGTLALLWSTVWDTEADAVEFEQALRAMKERKCWRDGEPIPGAAPGWAIRGTPTFARKGSAVVLARGFGSKNAATTKPLFRLVGTRPEARPPLGAVALVPSGPRFPSRLEDGAWMNEGFGLAAEVPQGFAAQVDTDTSALQIASPAGVGTVSVPEGMTYDPTSVEQFFKGILLSLAKQEPTEIRRDPLEIAGNQGTVRFYRLGATGAQLAVALVPLCGGKRAASITLFYGTPEGAKVMGSWLSTVRAAGPSPSPACVQ